MENIVQLLHLVHHLLGGPRKWNLRPEDPFELEVMSDRSFGSYGERTMLSTVITGNAGRKFDVSAFSEVYDRGMF